MAHQFCHLQPAQVRFEDGVPFALHFNDVYFSKENGLRETEHVYIDGNDLRTRFVDARRFVIGELGFGTGLNFLCTWACWEAHAPARARLHYISCELHPLLVDDLQRALALWPELSVYAQALLAQYPGHLAGVHHCSFAEGRVVLTLMFGEATRVWQDFCVSGCPQLEAQVREALVDAWYLDGFSPNTNPKMWTQALLRSVRALSKPGTTVASFSVARVVKDGLAAVGFQVHKRVGFGRKRACLQAVLGDSVVTNKGYATPWHLPRKTGKPAQDVAIIGAGLAGCMLARDLAQRGWQVTLIDGHSEPGQGASENPYAVIYPCFSAFDAPFTRFMLAAFCYAMHCYAPLKSPLGILQTVDADSLHLADFLAQYPHLGQWVDAETASRLSGIAWSEPAWWIPHAAHVDAGAFCKQQAQHTAIAWRGNTRIETLEFVQGQWDLGGLRASNVVICAGFNSIQFHPTADLPIRPIAGLLSLYAQEDAKILLPLCGKGHILPAQVGKYAIGASYHLNQQAVPNEAAAHQHNLESIQALPAMLPSFGQPIGAWHGVRGATPDYLPIVGPVPELSGFGTLFEKLAYDAQYPVAAAGTYLPGLYVAAGFGSRGLTSIPLAMAHLADWMDGGMGLLNRAMAQSIAPARWKIREIMRRRSGK